MLAVYLFWLKLGDNPVGQFVYVCHSFGLLAALLNVILFDTDRIDPQRAGLVFMP